MACPRGSDTPRKFIDLDRCPIGSRRRRRRHNLRFAHSAGNSLPLKPAPPWPLNHVSHHRPSRCCYWPSTQRGMRSSVMQAAVKIFHSTLRSHKLVTCGGNCFLSPVWSTRATADRYRPTVVPLSLASTTTTTTRGTRTHPFVGALIFGMFAIFEMNHLPATYAS